MHSPRSSSEDIFGTFGLYRYCLALLVILTHTSSLTLRFAGEYGVFALFILSGYVVSYILSKTYLHSPGGLWRYAINRMVRIYPLYWTAFCLSLVLLLLLPRENKDILIMQGIPDSLSLWMINIFTFGMTHPVTGISSYPLVLTPAWSLAIEMTYWAIIPILLTHKRIMMCFFLLAVSYTLYVFLKSLFLKPVLTEWIRYFNIPSAALPFCMGLAIFKLKSRGEGHMAGWAGKGVIIAFFLLILITPLFSSPIQVASFYLAFLLNTFIIMYLSQIDQRSLSPRFLAIDKIAGDCAYPLYLIHIPVAVLLHRLFPRLGFPGPLFCICTIILATLAAWQMHLHIQKPINGWREDIKRNVKESNGRCA